MNVPVTHWQPNCARLNVPGKFLFHTKPKLQKFRSKDRMQSVNCSHPCSDSTTTTKAESVNRHIWWLRWCRVFNPVIGRPGGEVRCPARVFYRYCVRGESFSHVFLPMLTYTRNGTFLRQVTRVLKYCQATDRQTETEKRKKVFLHNQTFKRRLTTDKSILVCIMKQKHHV